MTYSDKLKSPLWQKKRLEIFQRDKWKCVYCGDNSSTLHVHHERYQGDDPWDTPDKYLNCVCEHCHVVLGYLKNDAPEYKISFLRKRECGNTPIIHLFIIKLVSSNDEMTCISVLREGVFNPFPYLDKVHVDFLLEHLQGL